MSLKQYIENEIEDTVPITEKFIVYSMQAGTLLDKKGLYQQATVEKIDSLRYPSDLEGLLKMIGVPTELLLITLNISNVMRLSRYGDTNFTLKLIEESEVSKYRSIVDEF